MCCDKALYDRTVRSAHLETPGSIDKKVRLLRCSHIFEQWAPRHLERLAFFTDFLTIKQKDLVYDDQEKATSIYLLVSGRVHCTKLLPKTMNKVRAGQREKRIVKTLDKIELEICEPLSMLGLESLGNGISSFNTMCPAVYDSEVLRINTKELKNIVRKFQKNDVEQEGVTKEEIAAISNTIPLLVTQHEERVAWWESRRKFYKTYFDVTVKLTIESQCRHFKQICGSCGLRGHRPLNTL